MRKGNPMTNGTVAQAKKMYAEMGLCYSCGCQMDKCTCESILSAEEFTKRALCQTCNIAKDLRRCDDCKFKAYNYLHIGEAVQIVYGQADLLAIAEDWASDPRTPEEKALDEWQADARETEFGTVEWFRGVQPIEF